MMKILANDGIDANGKKILEAAGYNVITEKISQENFICFFSSFNLRLFSVCFLL